jgi:hypothetical protein
MCDSFEPVLERVIRGAMSEAYAKARQLGYSAGSALREASVVFYFIQEIAQAEVPDYGSVNWGFLDDKLGHL